jgi:A/G-specific adenine glycosylase
MTSVPRLRARLLDWYDKHRRALPWRVLAGETADPYRIWLSEVMLQQTTTVHAAPYFQAFTRRWPTVRDLAAAPEAEVMAAWAGLGYYARARNLIACARAVSVDHGGVFPDTEEGLRALPGLGPYTAAAVAAIAFDRPTNVVDGNVERVMARLFAVETPLPDAKPELKRLAQNLVNDRRPGDWAQALMDLGATICRPRSPDCPVCPLRSDCRGLADGVAASLPRRLEKAASPHRYGVVFAIMRDSHVGLVRRPPRGLLGGMLGLPTTAWRAAPWPRDEGLGHAPGPGSWRSVGEVSHAFTHFSLDLTVLAASDVQGDGDFIWTPLDAAVVETPSLFAKALRLLARPSLDL